MRRAPLVLTGTIAGLAGILTFHTHQTPTVVPVAAGSSSHGSGSSASGSGTAGSGGSSGSPGSAGSAASGGTSAGSSSGAGGSSSGSSGSSSGGSSASGAGASGSGTTSATGPMEQYGYGELAVRVTTRAGKITAVSTPTLQTADPYSAQLAQQVIPMLTQEVLANQSANISAVTGATYTSEAYASSLQAALDALHVG